MDTGRIRRRTAQCSAGRLPIGSAPTRTTTWSMTARGVEGPHPMYARLQELHLGRALLPKSRRALQLPPAAHAPRPARPCQRSSPPFLRRATAVLWWCSSLEPAMRAILASLTLLGLVITVLPALAEAVDLTLVLAADASGSVVLQALR